MDDRWKSGKSMLQARLDDDDDADDDAHTHTHTHT